MPSKFVIFFLLTLPETRPSSGLSSSGRFGGLLVSFDLLCLLGKCSCLVYFSFLFNPSFIVSLL